MNYCPNCGNKISKGQPVCQCGDLLRADATHHANSWETETVFRPARKPAQRFVLPLVFALIIVTSVFLLAWPQLNGNRRSGDVESTSPDQSTSQSETSSDLVDSDSVNGDVTRAGVFEFSHSERTSETGKSKAFHKMESNIAAVTSAETASITSSQIAIDTSAPVKTDEKPLADCKPEIKASIKATDQAATLIEDKPQSKTKATNYILGPRGGCFFVTDGGSKKYVDHSLCGNSATAAARQD